MISFLRGLPLLLLTGTQLSAHCQVPCGIYDDALRIVMMREDITTVEKAMDQITALSATIRTDPLAQNQSVRWINTKEEHAGRIQEIVSAYFLTQRIKQKNPGDFQYQTYVNQTTLLQRMLVSAMKCRQTLDKSHTEELRSLIDQFIDVYFDTHGKKHLKELENR